MTPTAAPLLELREVSLAPGDAPPVHGISFSVDRGEIVALAGPSGSGKTTALRTIVRLADPRSGTVFLEGVATSEMPGPQLRRRIGLVAQQPAMFGPTVADDLAAGLAAALPPGSGEAALAEFGLSPTLLGRASAALSGGEQARVAIARALFLAPQVLLLDEPSAALDADATQLLAASLRSRAAAGLAIVLVSHDPLLLEGTAARAEPFPPRPEGRG